MKSALIYYTAHKTGYCETALKGCTESAGVNVDKVIAAVSDENLGQNINICLNDYNALFVVGDIQRNDKAGLMSVLSCGLKDFNVSSKILKAEQSKGYLLEFENKKIVVLPDIPEKISRLVSAQLLDYLKNGEQ
ncbi:MAG: hypothetical protein UE295_08425 [Acutalibacteraceae bacterium]|nr:hypothetical protein [Acutalibacteraceae bacterium]